MSDTQNSVMEAAKAWWKIKAIFDAYNVVYMQSGPTLTDTQTPASLYRALRGGYRRILSEMSASKEVQPEDNP